MKLHTQKIVAIIVIIAVVGYLIFSNYESFSYQDTGDLSSVGDEKRITDILMRVGVEEFANKLNDSDSIVLDVRTVVELEETGVIRTDVVNIDFYEDDFENRLNSLDKSKSYLVYCRSGNRSSKTLELMKKLGFTHVVELEKGINSWIADGRRVYERESDEFEIITIAAERFRYEPNSIRIKQDANVALNIENKDTLHGAYVIGMETNQDDNGYLILDTSSTGTYTFICANMCGAGHNNMKGEIIIE